MKNKDIVIPSFSKHIVADNLRDGYWLESPDIDQDGSADLFGYGLSLGEIYWYRNPSWTRYLVTDGIRMPVGADYADISGNKFPDIIVCYDLYGEKGNLYDANSKGGKIDWIENPGQFPVDTNIRWKRHYIGKTTGMHRLRAGYFTQSEKLEIIGLPIVPHGNIHSILPIVMFTQPEDVYSSEEWPMEVIDDSNFRLIHGAEKKKGLIKNSDRDSLFLASDEGITWFYFDLDKKKWCRESIGCGELTQVATTGFKGSGDVGVGKIFENDMAFIAAVEPFHGNTIAAYIKDTCNNSWTRHVLDIFGDPNESGEGPGHQIVCADFDNDGADEFLVALRGPWPWQGVFYYKCMDIEKGIFTRWRVSDESVARIAIADFNGDGRLDFATISYAVPHYFEAKEPRIVVHKNCMSI